MSKATRRVLGGAAGRCRGACGFRREAATRPAALAGSSKGKGEVIKRAAAPPCSPSHAHATRRVRTGAAAVCRGACGFRREAATRPAALAGSSKGKGEVIKRAAAPVRPPSHAQSAGETKSLRWPYPPTPQASATTGEKHLRGER